MDIEIKRLEPDRWQDYRDLRLEALRSFPLAYGSSYEEETKNTEEHWRMRIRNVLFAMVHDTPVGIMVWVRNPRLKTNHICEIYGVYVKREYQGQGIGSRLMAFTLEEISKHEGIIKVILDVNPTQKAAYKLYRKFGFRKSGVIHRALRIDGKYYDEFLMEKFL
jgi:ribosomal protein S18 acetylase RimI-like enzyme